MNATGSNAALLRTLGLLDPAGRLAAVRAEGDAAGVLRGLIESVRTITHADLDAAVRATAWLPALVDELGDARARVDVRALCATAMSYANRFDSALELLGEARAVAASDGDASQRARVELASVQPLARLGRLAEAVACGERAVELYEAAGDAAMAARAHSNLGVVRRMAGDVAGALRHFERALPGVEHEPMALGQLESNRATALLDLCRFAEAERAFRRAQSAFDGAGASRASGIAEGNLADLLGRLGKLQASLRHFERAIRTLERGDSPGDAARLHAERAEVLASIGALREAVESFDSAIVTLDSCGMSAEATRARFGRALALGRRGDLRGASDALGEVAARQAAAGSRGGVGRAHAALAEVKMRAGLLADSRALLAEARRELADHAVSLAETLAIECEVELADGRPEAALPVAGRASALIAQSAHSPLRARLLHGRGRALAALGDAPAAIGALGEAVQLIEGERGTLSADRLRAAWLGDRVDVYADLVRVALDDDEVANAGLAFRAVEQVKCRSLLDMVQGGIELAEQVVGSLHSPEESRLFSRLTGLRAELNALYSRVDGADSGAAPVRAVRMDRIPAIEREVAHLEGRLASTRRFGELYGTPIELDDVRGLLDDRTVLLEYSTLGDELGAFVVSRSGVRLGRRLCSRDALREACGRVSFQIDRALLTSGAGTARLKSRAIEALGALYALVVEPVADSIEGFDRVVVVPSGELFGVAVHALHDGERHLIERAAVSYSPSASLLGALRQRSAVGASRTAQGVLIAGVADDAAPRIDEEVRRVSAAVGGEVLAGPMATADRVFGLARVSRLIHIASHGVFPESAPLDAAIRLADRWVTARDAFALDLPGSVVVLSCCDAGRHAVASGDEIYGLGRAFLAAGASSLITSLWSAHDETTMKLMDLMYGAYSGQPESEKSMAPALASAQRRLINDGVHPAQWAPFLCAGEL